MSVQNGERLATKQDLADMYQGILPYLGGMPEMVANKFSKGDLYSTDEKMIGQWIDGKPLYQRTFDITNPTTGTTLLENVDNCHIKNCLVFRESGTDSADGQYSLVIGSNESYCIDVFNFASTHTVYLSVYNNASYMNIHRIIITVNYTKSSDSPISIGSETDYSTEEKIIGTWIDGKPIYQKTFVIPSITSGYNFTVENLKSIVYSEGYFKFSSGDGGVIPYVYENVEAVSISYNSSKSKVYINSNIENITDVNITIQYTKTTD